MVYIHVKKVGDRNYYTLRISVRDKNGRVITKDLENLGRDIKKINIENLEKKYKKDIRKSYRTIKQFLESNHYLDKVGKQKLKKSPFFSKDQLLEIEAIRLHYAEKFLPMDSDTKKEVYEIFLIKFAVSSTSIEGNTITLQQASKLLTENILPKGKTLREVYDLQNTKSVFFNLMEGMPKISLKMIEKTHDNLLDRIDVRRGYRTHDLRILGQPFKPSPGRYVRDDIKLLLEWYHKNRGKIHPLALAIFFHHKFENIHPFSDGNGRVGRILLNHMLIREKYPMLIIPKTLRKGYIDLLNDADKGLKKNLLDIDMKYYNPLFKFITNEYSKTYWNNFLV